MKDLRGFLDSQGVSYKGIVEKEDLEAKAKQTLSRMHNTAEQVCVCVCVCVYVRVCTNSYIIHTQKDRKTERQTRLTNVYTHTHTHTHTHTQQVYGPFSTADMRAWAEQGYFSGTRVTLIRYVCV